MGTLDKVSLHLQYLLGRLAVFLLGPFVYVCVWFFGYRVRELNEIRKRWRVLTENHRGPWIICANHLTNIDSVIIAYALAPLLRYLTNFKLVPWNLPERANFQKNLLSTLFCYLTKCIPVSRGGERKEMRKVLEKCIYLLKRGQYVLIFPEGGRSRTGRVNKEGFSYGVGRFISNVENCKVLCLYLRGDHQDTYSDIPKLKETFTVYLQELTPEKTDLTGLREQRHYAEQIINCLAKMEEQYFASHRQRHSRSDEHSCSGQEQRYPISQTGLSPH